MFDKLFMATVIIGSLFAGAALDALGLHNWAKRHFGGR